MDRDKFFAELDQLTPEEIEKQLLTWDMEKLVLAQEYLAKPQEANQPKTGQPPRRNSRMEKVVTGRTIAAAIIALGLVLAALVLRGGYEIAGSSLGAYVVNRFTGATWQCSDVCVRLDTFTPEKKKN
jgi:hypothetical protein